MKDIFCLWPKPQKGVQVFLDAVLAEHFNIEDPMAEHTYEWARTRGTKRAEFPDLLWLICREKLLLFDYYPFGSGFIVSHRFLSVLDHHVAKEKIQYVPLKVRSIKGSKITDKDYFYLRFLEKIHFINYAESKFHVKKDANMDLVMKAGFGIERFEKIVSNNVVDDVFIPLDSIFQKYIFCSNLMKEELTSEGLYGFDLIFYFELPLLYNDRYRD